MSQNNFKGEAAMHSQAKTGLRVKSGLTAGAIVCYDDSSGVLMPVVTPCSTGGYYPPAPAVFPPVSPIPDAQWLDCRSCTGTARGSGQLGPARCEVCYTVG
jgi:hypothetical protein